MPLSKAAQTVHSDSEHRYVHVHTYMYVYSSQKSRSYVGSLCCTLCVTL